MNRWFGGGWIAGLLIAAVAVAQEVEEAPAPAETPAIVVITLKNGITLEGILRSENDQQVLVEEKYAGGTITQTTTIPRSNIVTMTQLDSAELAVRQTEAAWQNLQRYRLSPQNSYTLEYYHRVITNVLQAFLDKYPTSAHATAVSQELARWEAERSQVAGGKTKYQGRWLPAAEAGRLMAEQQGPQLLEQAKTMLKRRQYAAAIDRLQFMQSSEAQTLTRQAYQSWLADLRAERMRLLGGVSEAEQQAASAISVKKQLVAANQQRQQTSAAGDGAFQGPTQEEVVRLNQASEDILTGSNQIQRLRAQIAHVDQEVVRLTPAARQAGLEVQSSGATVVAVPVNDAQAPIVAREDYGNPSILRNIVGFLKEYWVGLVIGFGVIVWYFTRKMAR